MPLKALVATDPVYFRSREGKVYTNLTYTYERHWKVFLAGFDEILVAARIRPVETVDENWQRADGEGVRFRAVPFYHGPAAYLKNYIKLNFVLWKALLECDVLNGIIPSFIANIAVPLAKIQGKPFVLNVVGDPFDVFAPDSMKHPLRPFFRWWFTPIQYYHCKRALAVSYVTQESLQRRYPPGRKTFTHATSNVYLPDEAFLTEPRQHFNTCPLRLIMITTLDQLYKAPDKVIEAIAPVKQRGLKISLTIIGEGRYRRMLENLASELGIADAVYFTGQLPPGQPVREQFDKADIFVLPSHAEGLPRAMIEAMARGLPCIGSHAGGIPELLPPEDRVPPGDSQALAEKIIEMASDPARLIQTSARNLQKAREYHASIIQARKEGFYRTIRQMVLDHVRD